MAAPGGGGGGSSIKWTQGWDGGSRTQGFVEMCGVWNARATEACANEIVDRRHRGECVVWCGERPDQAGKQHTTPAAAVSRVDASVPQKSFEGSRTNSTESNERVPCVCICSFDSSVALIDLCGSCCTPCGGGGRRVNSLLVGASFLGARRSEMPARGGGSSAVVDFSLQPIGKPLIKCGGVDSPPTTHPQRIADAHAPQLALAAHVAAQTSSERERVCAARPSAAGTPPPSVPRRESRRSSVCAVLERFGARHTQSDGWACCGD